MNAIKALEDWHGAEKGRYVSNMGIETTYGATCWSLTLGNSNVQARPDWHMESDWAKKYNKAEVHAAEVAFFTLPYPGPPNVVFAKKWGEKGWPGLERTILVAIERAEELGL